MPLSKHTILFGGSFSPPHIGHQVACLWMTEALGAKVILVPTFNHPNKNLIDIDYRIEMCKIMASPFGNKVSVSDIEKRLPVPSRTYNLIQEYKERNIVLAIGSDLVNQVENWYRWNDIQKMVKILVVGRNNNDNDYSKIECECFHYPIELSAISSSEIRSMINNRKDITGLVPSRIKKYIYEQGLYK